MELSKERWADKLSGCRLRVSADSSTRQQRFVHTAGQSNPDHQANERNVNEFLRYIHLYDETEAVARRLRQLGLTYGLHGKRILASLMPTEPALLRTGRR